LGGDWALLGEKRHNEDDIDDRSGVVAMKNPLGSLMQQAQEMQEKFRLAQEELARTEIQGEAGGGLVKVVMNGKREVLRLNIDDSLFK